MNFNEIPGLSQEHMEAWFREGTGPDSPRLKNGVIAKMKPSFVSCDFLAGESVMSFQVLDWELNPQQMIHGGITSTGFDTSLGMLCHYYASPNILTTVNLSTSFLRPIRLGDTMFFHSKIKSFGRSLVTMDGEVYLKSSGKLAATATGTFKILHYKTKQKLLAQKAAEEGKSL
ncbi:PaaI family thioesterase [Anaerotignum lactatifermentans]|uniref:PaaI family thioesterase n=1 Tax=Anaerotignum lactatifermentans TaxID=160404 RepID=A0ABS2GC81_9FIRM|nr:PaaI family thioesterase [Anaerotignum lactatifermentans]MBM6830077.1 PaaI family thioesterase [Anaerotignum lactatifermentans]MBM6878320.1 PaaI family thioesterase [Anaerotignum lactatifermentans]MBM6951475.1 PaaI family thioesterase [Anaerotignum lactatifermentans]